jgi:hypothetical protein
VAGDLDWEGDLQVAVLCLVYCTVPVLDIMAVVLLALHDVVNNTGRAVLTVILRATAQLLLLTLTVTLVDIAAGFTSAPIVVEVVTQVARIDVVSPAFGLLGFVLIDLLLDGWKVGAPGSMRLTMQMMAR